eukprot:CAMPEP_0178581524 /NCGR_PEP_ID=MMETSP0697-20121206/23228_1 /TAXON_ID=265572 /ORGANISM="Extubocellulus spinifer, Strain CCMP396" /LENGTH=48 /DNA_ID= /DNA_START= /DNA_END= /DNA_ORIENTATION=
MSSVAGSPATSTATPPSLRVRSPNDSSAAAQQQQQQQQNASRLATATP